MITGNYIGSPFKVTEWTKKYRKNGMEFTDFLALCKIAGDQEIPSTDEEVKLNKKQKNNVYLFYAIFTFLDLI